MQVTREGGSEEITRNLNNLPIERYIWNLITTQAYSFLQEHRCCFILFCHPNNINNNEKRLRTMFLVSISDLGRRLVLFYLNTSHHPFLAVLLPTFSSLFSKQNHTHTTHHIHTQSNLLISTADLSGEWSSSAHGPVKFVQQGNILVCPSNDPVHPRFNVTLFGNAGFGVGSLWSNTDGSFCSLVFSPKHLNSTSFKCVLKKSHSFIHSFFLSFLPLVVTKDQRGFGCGG